MERGGERAGAPAHDVPALRWASELALLLSFREEISLPASGAVVAATRAIADAVAAARLPGIRDLHPGYCTLLITLEPGTADPERIESEIRRLVAALPSAREHPARRTIEVPVCYDLEVALDLAEVAARAGTDPEGAARLHAAATYRVAFLGFTPGFPYLLGLPPVLACPRLPVPRRRVPAGSVAIAGAQAGIYPFDTPGGWRIVGRTPLPLFDLRRDPPALLETGDEVRFVPITTAELRAERRVSTA